MKLRDSNRVRRWEKDGRWSGYYVNGALSGILYEGYIVKSWKWKWQLIEENRLTDTVWYERWNEMKWMGIEWRYKNVVEIIVVSVTNELSWYGKGVMVKTFVWNWIDGWEQGWGSGWEVNFQSSRMLLSTV